LVVDMRNYHLDGISAGSTPRNCTFSLGFSTQRRNTDASSLTEDLTQEAEWHHVAP
jgi:putative salt-induced outer membrane protein YdiY